VIAGSPRHLHTGRRRRRRAHQEEDEEQEGPGVKAYEEEEAMRPHSVLKMGLLLSMHAERASEREPAGTSPMGWWVGGEGTTEPDIRRY
jgi:hypothetical protein